MNPDLDIPDRSKWRKQNASIHPRELNELADRIRTVESDLLAAHCRADEHEHIPMVERTRAAGPYEAGKAVTTANISAASNGDISITADIDFGDADEAVGTVGWWSLVRGSDGVAYGTLPSTVIGNGDSFKINADSLDINGSTT